MTARWPTVMCAAVALATGCQRGSTSGADAGARGGATAFPTRRPPPPPDAPIALSPPPPDSGGPRAGEAPRPLPSSGARVRFAAGGYRLGSEPGDPGRDPAVEADLTPVRVGEYDIDALPYPNDPSQPIATGMTRAQAQQACAARGRRLCGEVEWERACRGAAETVYPGGAAWDGAVCGQGSLGACATREGVFAMGTRYAEWTRDDIDARAIIRGGGATATAAQHRCASRRTATAEQAGLEVAFRCCGGDAPAVPYPRETSRRPFVEERLTATQVAEIIRAVPELERLHLRDGLAMFLPGAINEVMNHGATTVQLHPEMNFTVSPLRWSPTFGEEVLVLVAKSRVGSWVAALWVLPDGRYRHAASFLLREDPVALTLAWGNARREVVWSACWNCGGEHGTVSYTDENRVVIIQR